MNTSSERKKSVKVSNWYKCYGDGWGKRLRPASYSHPAKASYALTVRIYEHAIEEGWIKPGDYLIDIFAGIGGFALEAMRNGLHFVGCELEQRFVDMGQGCDCTGISKEDWARYQGRWDRMRYKDGRHWCPECLMKAGVVTDEREFKPLPLPGMKWAALAKTHQPTLFDAAPSTSYKRNSGKIPCTGAHRYHGNIETWEQDGMTGTAVIVQGDSRRLGEVLARASLCLSSPPYANSAITTAKNYDDTEIELAKASGKTARRATWGHNKGSGGQEGYGETAGNLGNLPDTGFEAALAVASPPFGAAETRNRTPFQGGDVADMMSRAYTQDRQGTSPGQLAQMPEGSFDMALSSPVYIGNTASDDPDKRGGLYRDPKRRNDKTLTATYSADAAQLAQMPEGDLALALGSPPYVGSLGDGKSGIDWSKQADRETAHPHGWDGDGYGAEPGQLAALPEGDHAAACERPVCAISSPPWQGADRRGCPESKWQLMQAAARDGKGHSSTHLPPSMGIDYGDEEGQLGAMPPGSHAEACLPEHGQALEAGAVTPACADRGRAQCAISSPPWEATNACEDPNYHEDRVTPGSPLHGDYGTTAGQLGQETGSTFWAASRQILEQVYKVLAPGGHAIFVCKRFVRNKAIVDFPLQWARLCEAVGFKWIHHHKAWLVEDRGAQHTLEGGLETRTVKRCSFFRRLAESKGSPAIDWEDILCFVKE